ncbi:MAG: pyruvate formate lyase-activating protein [Clostridia bacterium]|nr:pyruvate formate lyase-activating protein [Clostridia bacterium]
MRGFIHSIQTLGTVDGPGVRFVVFFQGCNLRCSCCHNPDTWDMHGGKETETGEMIDKLIRYKSYFGKDGGITLSGGEPLLQADFAREIFEESHKHGINTCLDTSGSILDGKVKELLKHTDRVLLDIKYTTDEMYRKYVGCSLERPMEFLSYLDNCGIPTTLRQVIIPSLNDTVENMAALSGIIKKHHCIDKTELLPFRKLCLPKYQNLGIEFPFEDMETPSADDIKRLYDML